MHLISRSKRPHLAFFMLVLLSLTLIASLPRDAAAQLENTWELKIPKTRLDGVYGVVGGDGKVYIYKNSFSCYDPSTNDFIKKAPLVLPFNGDRRGDSVVYDAVALQNEIYMIGGVHSVWQNLDYTFIRIYNISDDSWTNGTATDYHIEDFPMANVVDGKIYLLDGRSGRLGVLDPASNTWIIKTPLPVWYLSMETVDTRIDQTVVINDRIYCFTSPNNNSPPRMIIYDTKTDTWLPGADLPFTDSEESYDVFACATSGRYDPQKIYYIGAALFQPTNVSFNYVYDPANGSWSTAKPLLTPSLGYYANTVLEDKIYYFDVGGSGIEVYTPIGYSTTPLPPSPPPIYPQANPIPKTNPLVYAHLAIVAIIVALSILLVLIYLHRFKARKAVPPKNRLP
jgi:hypothetical protein